MLRRPILVLVIIATVMSMFNGITWAAGKEVTINMLASVGGSGKSFSKGIELFNERYKGQYQVKVTLIANESLLEKEMMQFITRVPTYDVLAINTVWLPGVSRYLEPLNPWIKKHGPQDIEKMYGASTVDRITFDGNVVGLPIRFGTYILFYRSDWFKEAGLNVPSTLEEYVVVAKKLTKPGTYGTSMQLQSPAWSTEAYGCFLLPYGGAYLTDDLRHASPSLTDEVGIKVLNFLKELHDSKVMPNPLEWTYDDNVVAFQSGKIAFSHEYSARATILEDPKRSVAAGKMGYDILPTPKIPVGPHTPRYLGTYWTLAIDRNSKNKEAAYKFIKFMADVEAQRYMAFKADNGPTVLSIYDDPEYRRINPAAQAIKKAITTLGISEYLPVPQYQELLKVIHEELQAFIIGKQDAAKTARRMRDRIDETLGR
ncbi:MAG: sugar ABC transporter substrate-binding protein [Firmicutes bacterium]|nr:sugar ABC transporter substrate-binding protein [Bacillota bacterium]